MTKARKIYRMVLMVGQWGSGIAIMFNFRLVDTIALFIGFTILQLQSNIQELTERVKELEEAVFEEEPDDPDEIPVPKETPKDVTGRVLPFKNNNGGKAA